MNYPPGVTGSEDEIIGPPEIVLQEYTCARCGYHYRKQTDYEPFLCYRCMRFIAKKVFIVMQTIQPAISRPEVSAGEV